MRKYGDGGTAGTEAAPLGELCLSDEECGRLVDVLAERITADELRELVEGFPPPLRRLVLEQARTGAARNLSQAGTGVLLRLLKGGHPRKHQIVAAALASEYHHGFADPKKLDRDDCIAHLTPGGELGVRLLALPRAWPRSLSRWGLAKVLEARLPLAPVALGLLTAEAAELGEEAEKILHGAWTELRNREPGLPEEPAGPAELMERMDARDALREDAAEPEDEDGLEPVDRRVLAELVTEIRDSFVLAVPAAERLLTALRTGARPEDEDVDAVRAVRDGFDEARDLLARLRGDSSAATVDDLERELETEAAATRLRALAGLRGPEGLEDTLQQVREAALVGEPAAALEVMLALVLWDGENGDENEAVALETRAYQELPVEWRGLIRPIGRGLVAVEPEDSAAPAAAAAPVRAPAPETEPAPEPGPVARPRAEQTTDTEDTTAESSARHDLQAFLGRRLGTGSGASEPRERPETPEPTATGPIATEPGTAESTTTAPEATAPEAVGTETGLRHGIEEAEAVLGPEAAQAEREALATGRLGLAAWIREAEGRPEAEVRARRAAALADEVVEFSGRPAPEFTELVRGLTARSLGEDAPGRLLAFASVIRAGLVYPTHDSTKVLEELAPVVSSHPGLSRCAEAFARAAKAGAYLVRGRTEPMRDSADPSGLRRAAAAARAAELLDQGLHRRIKYTRATEVWKLLLQPDRDLGRALTVVRDDDASRYDEIRDLAARWRGKGFLDRRIDELAAELATGRNRNRIEAGARLRLTKRVREVLDVVDEWIQATQAGQVIGIRADEDWAVRALSDLRDSVLPLREAVEAELDALAEPHGAALGTVRGLLRAAFSLLDGTIPEPTERRTAHLLHGDLLLIPGLPVDARTLEPARVPRLDELLPVASTETPDWTAAFEARAALFDHEGTRGLVSCIERLAPELSTELRLRREELVRAARSARDGRIEELRDKIAQWLRDGTLGERESLVYEERLRAFGGAREDFGAAMAAMDALAEELGGLRATEISQARRRLDRRVEANPRLAAAAERAARLVAEGDLTTANELMEQADRGVAAPEAASVPDHFSRFFPDFPKTFDDILVRSGRRARRNEGRELIQDVVTALRSGQNPADPGIEKMFARAGIVLPALRPARREDAREGLGQWLFLSQGQKTAGNFRTGLDKLLRMIGLEAEQAQGFQESHRTWMELSNVRPLGRPLLPAFGSGMSPSGDSLRLLLVWRAPGVHEVLEMLKDEPGDRTVLVLYFGVLSTDLRTQLAVASRGRPLPVAGVIDEAMIAYLAGMEEPSWAVTVSLMAPFTSTNPYTPMGDVPEEMFMGRDVQLEQVKDRAGSSFVYGGRQLGKSALLSKAERDLLQRDPGRIVILESIQDLGKAEPAERLWPKLGARLEKRGVIPAGLRGREEITQAVRAWSEADASRQLLILLDEADEFLNEDAREGGFVNVTAIRDLMTSTRRRVKVVFAGLHQTGRFQSLSNQPLAHLGAPIAIGPLLPQHAFDLLVSPFATLGFTFPENLACRVIAEANNAPALVQLFAEELLFRLRRNPQTAVDLPYAITRADIEAVWRDRKVAQGIRDRFEWTLNLDKRYKVIAYVVALHGMEEGMDATLAANELREQCVYWWAPGFSGCSADGFRSLLEECVNLGVLRVDGERYRLRTPHILRLLGGSEDVVEALIGAQKFDKPDSFDPNSYRVSLGDGRSPLTAGQLSVLARARNGLHLVAGSRATHIDRVASALKAGRADGVHWVRAGTADLPEALAEAARHDGHGMVVYSPSEADDFERVAERLDEAKAALEEPVCGTLAVVAVLAPEWSALWTGEVMGLSRFNKVGVRQWLHEEFGVRDQGVDRVLETTAGWPMLVHRVAAELRRNGADLEAALADCADHLTHSATTFVRDAGLESHPVLAMAWEVLIDNEPDERGELAELLRLYEEEVPVLGNVQEHGYPDTEAVVDALYDLGALELTETGKLVCERILKTATVNAREPQ